MKWEDYKKGGYDKHNLKKDFIEEAHSRVSYEGKVYRGEAGRNLKKKLLEKQQYFERQNG